MNPDDPKMALDPQWAKMAAKELKGEDPAKRLVWHTPEVRQTGDPLPRPILFYLFFD